MTTINSKDIPDTPYQYHWLWGLIFAAITVVTVALRYALPVRDGDIWWHMLYGKYFLNNQTLIADHTIFSWTPTTNETIYCTWLPDILLYLIHEYSGLPGLFAFRYFCLFLFVFACYLFARKLKGTTHPLVWFIILIGILMAYTAAFLKPEIVSFALMTLLVWNWWNIRAGGKNIQYWCYAFPLIMLIWVNSHGTFVFGYIFLMAITLGEIMNTRWSHGNALSQTVRKHLWFSIGLSLLVVFLNPYGWHYPFKLFFDLIPTEANNSYNSKITAYAPTFKYQVLFHNFAFFVNTAIVFVLALLCIQFRKRRVEWSSLLSLIIFTLLYSLYLRTTFYLGPVLTFPCIYMLLSAEISLPKTVQKRVHFLLPPIVLVFTLYISISTVHSAFTVPENDILAGNFNISGNNPVDEAKYIKENFPSVRIGNGYNFGAYLLWTLWPDNKVFFDSRHFPYKEWSDEYFKARTAEGFSELLEKYPCDLWVFDHSESILSSYFRYSPDWKLAFYGRDGQVFVAKNIQLPGDGRYQVSEKINTLPSRLGAYPVFLFALSIYDWETAELIADREITLAQKKNKKIRVDIYNHLLSGIRAFAEKKYDVALRNLEKIGGSASGLGGYVVMSHLHLAQWELESGNLKLAAAHTQLASELLPGAFYTQYNTGLTRWLIHQENISGKSEKVEVTDYNMNFKNFLLLVKGSEHLFQEEIDFAQKVLTQSSKAKPETNDLLIPTLKNLVE